MIAIVDAARKVRLRGLMARHLTNWRDLWEAYEAGAPVPPLAFRDGTTMHHGAADAPAFLFFEIFANGCYRRRMPLPASGTVVDVGANIGAFVLDAARHAPSLRFEAYEPNPVSFAMLKRNVEANRLTSRVRLHPEAVAGRDGRVHMRAFGNSLTPRAIAADDGAPDGVAAVSLATVISRSGPVALLKMDAEGAEAEIVEQASSVTLASIDAFVGEYHDDLIPDVVDRLRRRLEADGFAFSASRTHRCGPQFAARRTPR